MTSAVLSDRELLRQKQHEIELIMAKLNEIDGEEQRERQKAGAKLCEHVRLEHTRLAQAFAAAMKDKDKERAAALVVVPKEWKYEPWDPFELGREVVRYEIVENPDSLRQPIVHEGVRYEYLRPFQDKYNKLANVDLDTDPLHPQLILAGQVGAANFINSRAMMLSAR